MAAFLYFLPKVQAGSPDAVRALDAIDRPGYTFRGVNAGPGGDPGQVVGYFHGHEARVRYAPGEQQWRKIPGVDAWVGFYTADPPGPDDLVRPDPLPGVPVTLGDGRDWIVPVLLAWRGDEDGAGFQWQLPRRTDLDDEGRWVPGDVVPRYRELFAQGQRWFDYITQRFTAKADESDDVDDPDATVEITLDTQEYFDTALAVLSANYRLGRAEVALLGLFDDDVPGRVLNTAVDFPTFQAWLQKKTPPASGPIVDGPGD